MKNYIFLILALFGVLLLASCNQQLDTEETQADTSLEKSTIIQNNEVRNGDDNKNMDAKFRFKFPQTWSSVKVTFHKNADWNDTCYSFDNGQPFCIFSVIQISKEQLKKNNLDSLKILSESGNTVFASDGCYEEKGNTQFNEFQIARCKEVPEILKTFTMIP